MSDAETKEALKAALKEWLDEKYATIGRWSVRTVVVMGLAVLAWAILMSNGWQRVVH